MSNQNTPVPVQSPPSAAPVKQQQGERKDENDCEKKNVREANIIAAKGILCFI